MKKGEKMSDELKLKLSLAGKGKVFSDEHRANLSKSHMGKTPSNIEMIRNYNKGKKFTPEHRAKMSEALKGRTLTYKSEDTRKKALQNLRTVAWNKGLKGYNSGSKNPNWIKDRSLLKKHNRQIGTRHTEWARACKSRDGRKCKLGGKDCSGQLEVHHILRFSEYPELRYQISNGITLCHAHHPRKKSDEDKLRELFIKLIS